MAQLPAPSKPLDAVVITEPKRRGRRTGSEVTFRIRSGHEEHEVYASGIDFWPMATLRRGERVTLRGAFESKRRAPRFLARSVER
ncbi:hypothetical protein GCM10025867_48880 (plasmid) [Frondihabitans sucicola]|uniref:Uncharacterized protein n=1 Tax=Frondihabitans sucicola TaxID=1268041 RepID=A0ABN6Y5N9_9MICO|nr:hypothetical protein [Frondihabitans sucicola]BDZ52647.1 hypothetical protein GCM10025867_48880 [Frondihabitans sucicola]